MKEPDFDIQIFLNGANFNEFNINLTDIKITKFLVDNPVGKWGCKVTTKWFQMSWTPFSLQVSVRERIIQTGRSGSACAIDTLGMLGSWATGSVVLRNGADFLNESKLANSWRVRKDEALISDWIPIYSAAII